MTSNIFSVAVMAVVFSFAAASFAQELRSNPPAGFPSATKRGVVEVRSFSGMLNQKQRDVVSNLAQQQSRGWLDAPEERAASIDGYFQEGALKSRLKPNLTDVLGTLLVAPANLEGTFLQNAKIVGTMPAGGYVNGGWTGVARAMQVPGIGNVVLEEYDYVAAGSHIIVPAELVDSEINGLPSQYAVWRTPSGKTWTEFRWFTSNKEFRLLLRKAIGKSDRSHRQLQELAVKLS
jgi:hypothetical protein